MITRPELYHNSILSQLLLKCHSLRKYLLNFYQFVHRLQQSEQQADMVVGDRLSSTYFTENTRPFHNLGNRLVRGSIQLLFRNNIMTL